MAQLFSWAHPLSPSPVLHPLAVTSQDLRGFILCVSALMEAGQKALGLIRTWEAGSAVSRQPWRWVGRGLLAACLRPPMLLYSRGIMRYSLKVWVSYASGPSCVAYMDPWKVARVSWWSPCFWPSFWSSHPRDGWVRKARAGLYWLHIWALACPACPVFS